MMDNSNNKSRKIKKRKRENKIHKEKEDHGESKRQKQKGIEKDIEERKKSLRMLSYPYFVVCYRMGGGGGGEVTYNSNLITVAMAIRKQAF